MKRGANLINFEPRILANREGPNINIIIRGGAKTDTDVESPHQIKIQKAIPKNTKYDPMQKKELFKGVVEMFKQMQGISMPKVVELIFNPNP